MKDLIHTLRWRGMIHDMIPGTEEQLNKELTAGYIGFDPTAPSLHIGNLASIMLLKQLQLAGHRPIALVGGATGMIGDPSWKNEERKLLDLETLRYNEGCIQKQLSRFLNFDSGENKAELVNNYDWFKDIKFLDFNREVGKHISVNYMMAKDSVKTRFTTGISFTEFTYQLLQGYDFYHLYTTKNVKLQMGGADQWGNLTTGTELIRRKLGEKAFVLTTPLITKADGTKFGKTTGGAVWLDPAMTSPYQFYQFFLNCADEEVSKLLKVFTLLEKAAIEELTKQHEAAPHQRIMQTALAKEVTMMVHSEEEYSKAVQATEILFGQAPEEQLATLEEELLLQAMEGVPQVTIAKSSWEDASDVTEFLSVITEGKIFSSKGETRKMIQGGGVRINKIKLTDPQQSLDFQLLQGKYLLIQKGKKNYYLVVVR